jgi:hypothetical protein
MFPKIVPPPWSIEELEACFVVTLQAEAQAPLNERP